jgi:hypothetical protein
MRRSFRSPSRAAGSASARSRPKALRRAHSPISRARTSGGRLSAGALSGQTITVSWTGATNTQTDSVLTVFSVTGASASAGAHTGAQDQSGATAALSLVVNAAGTGSLIFGCGVADNSVAQTALANTTINAHTEDATLFAEPAVWQKTTVTASAGNVTVGCSSNEGNYSKAAVEILNAGGIAFEDDHWKPSPAVTDEMVVSVYHG